MYDFALFFVFVVFPMLVGYAVLGEYIARKFWGWIWKGIVHICPICGTSIECRVFGGFMNHNQITL